MLRLGLLFFDDGERDAIRASVRRATTGNAWMVVEKGPYDAVLFARGPRASDDDDVAILTLSADATLQARGEAMPPIALRKPFTAEQLLAALEILATSAD